MLSNGVLVLACFTAIVAVAAAKPWSHSESEDHDWLEERFDGKDDDIFSWFDDRRDGRHDRDYEKERFQLFLYTIKSLRYKDDDFKSYNKVFKTFLKVVFQKKHNEYNGDFGLSKAFSDEHDDSDEWEELFDKDDFSYKYDDDIKEEKSKKLFMFHLKFKAHYLAQKELEKSRRNKEEKARRQYALFSELLDFCVESKSQRDSLEKFSKFVDLKLKLKFAAFKNCFFHNECAKDDDKDLDVYRGGEWKHYFSMDGSKEYYKDGDHFDLFLKLYKVISLKKDSHEEEDSFPDWDCDSDDDDWNNKNSVFRYITYLNKHLVDHNPKGFWGKRDHDKDEDNEKYLFFSLKAYKELKEEKALRERKEKLETIYGHFLKFIKHQEDSGRSTDEFYKFKKWHQIKENKDKLDKFSSFLKKISQTKKLTDSSSYDDDVKDKHEHFFQYNKYEDSEDKSDEDSLEDLFHDFEDKKVRSRHDFDW